MINSYRALNSSLSGGEKSFFDIITSRRSIRSFKPELLSTDVVERLLHAACSAPSAHNRQPWRFCVILDGSIKVRLARVMGEALRMDRIADGVDPDEARTEVDRSCNRITGASVVLVVCLTMEEMDDYADEPRSHMEYLMAVQSAAMAGENLLLTAHAEGLAACWMCAPLFSQEIVRETLMLPPSWDPQGLIILGFPEGEGRVRSRKPLEEVVLWR
jgi:coenzyme F420-0:L-glutamate ligase/coenzyme F420-1:gamma-L-glutamate ligase